MLTWKHVAMAFVIAAGILTFYFLILSGTNQEQVQRTEQMKACVTAGKSWVRDGSTNYYECK